MKYILIILILLATNENCSAQYNKEKISEILTGENEKPWLVTGINIDSPEKQLTFNKNNSVKIEMKSGKTSNEKWSLRTEDEIRWFLSIGANSYELIISYDKKGKEYVKLTRRSGSSKASGYYELKLTPLK